ncbi:MAG: FadR family transcriptional regulator [Gammaproteobacteria bacterium]|nr:FadR family transcriptional regulator [Gammaproteobacteria bacterium]
MSIDYRPLNTVSLSQQVANKIREAIASGTLKPEERLPSETELAERFRVSRPTIREALKRLAAQNLVRSQRGPTGGTFVTRPSPGELGESLTGAMTLLAGLGEFTLQEITTARRGLESICCRLAAEYHGEKHLQEIQMEIGLQQNSKLSHEDFCASDVRLHRAIADATNNGVLKFVMYAVIESLQPVANLVSFRHRERGVIVDQHQRLLAAIEKRDPDLAESVIQEQVDYLHQQQLRAKSAMQAKKHT